MIAAALRYDLPRDLDEALALLSQDPATTRLLGGGTWLVPELNRGVVNADRRVVDLRRAGLGEIRADGDVIHVGATCSYAALEASELIASRLPLLHAMAVGVTGGRQIRNQGTIGGSVAAARPQSDAPGALCALDAAAVIAGPGGTRRVAVVELLSGAMRTTLRRDEILVGFEIEQPGGGHGYHKLKRAAGSWPIATAAAILRLDGDGLIDRATLVLGGVCATPLVVPVADVMAGHRIDDDLIAAAAQCAADAVTEPWCDELATGRYRAAVAGPVAHRALIAAQSAAIQQRRSQL